jgi:hypothetical protein
MLDQPQFPSQQFPSPLWWGSYELLAFHAGAARTYLGIGVQEGHCVRHVVEANPDIAVTLCDTWGPHHGGTNRGSHAHVDVLLDAAGHRGVRQYLDGPSQTRLPQLGPEARFDLSYVDGAHEEAAAYADLTLVWPRTVQVMLVHDIRMPPVWSALTRWADTVEHEARITICLGGFGTAVVWRT